jgi:hypothetical protein
MTSREKNVVTGMILFVIVLAIITIGYGIYRVNELQSVVTKNEPIGGIYGVNLGDNIETLSKNTELKALDSYLDRDFEYNFFNASVASDNVDANAWKTNKITVYATKKSGTIYKIIYKNYVTDACDVAGITMDSLRNKYGLGQYTFLDAAFHAKKIIKDNRSIYINCGTSFGDSNEKVTITYKDSKIEELIVEEYKQYIIENTNNNLKLN